MKNLILSETFSPHVPQEYRDHRIKAMKHALLSQVDVEDQIEFGCNYSIRVWMQQQPFSGLLGDTTVVMFLTVRRLAD
jgi:hypothetical protein